MHSWKSALLLQVKNQSYDIGLMSEKLLCSRDMSYNSGPGCKDGQTTPKCTNLGIGRQAVNTVARIY